jgi:hypothetical protein
MIHTIENIRGKKIAVQCKTQEEANDFYYLVNYAHSYNYTSRIKTMWAIDEGKTGYLLNENGVDGVGVSNIEFWQDRGYEVVQFSELFNK